MNSGVADETNFRVKASGVARDHNELDHFWANVKSALIFDATWGDARID